LFRKINEEKKFIEKNPVFQRSENPILTVIITTYNQAHCIHKCIRSIQNQTIKNIEILIIDDCSTDNTTETINELQKIDPRIILIQHTMNEGKIKTRSDGIKLAKGKFITIIDGDDAFAHKDIFNHSLYIIQKEKIDIIEFQAASFKNQKFISIVNSYPLTNLTNIVYQPELRTKFFVIINDDKVRAIQSRSIWAKIIKTEVFKEALKYIGIKYTDDYISSYEDTILFVGILHIAKSYYYLKEIGYYYSGDESRSLFPKLKNKVCYPNNKIKDMGHIKLLHFLLDKTRNNEFEKKVVYHELISINHYSNLFKTTYHHFYYVYNIFDALIRSSYLSDFQKRRLLFIKKRIMIKEKIIKLIKFINFYFL